MRARAGDFLVLLAPTVVVGVLVPVVAKDDPGAYVPLLLTLLIIATIGIAFGLILLAQTTRGPSTFAIVVWREQAAFRVQPSFRRQCVFYGVLGAALVLMAFNGFRVGHLSVLRAMSYGIIVLTTLFLLILSVKMLRSGPLVLTAEGIAIDGGRSFVPWDALDTTSEPGAWAVGSPELVQGRRVREFRPGEDVPLEVSLYFLTRVIDLYARQPERRAAIGTPEELERLRGTLTRQVT
ncbi:hypothetical protein AB0H83_49580 [Dactylosporangium sp. NPDC050688]|uniref:hypothetical protein n=1 Tax=Dactylosporangium sp. NPDC050688 TaxID=3157217 RepID=UPI0033CDB7E0